MLRKLAKRSCVALLLRTGGAQLCGPVGQTGGCCHSVGFGSVGYLRYPTWRIARAWWFGFVFALEVGSLRLASVVIELPVCGCVGAARFSWMQLPQLICPQSSLKGVSSIDCWSRGKSGGTMWFGRSSLGYSTPTTGGWWVHRWKLLGNGESGAESCLVK